MEALSKELTTKLQLLEFKDTKMKVIVQGGNVETIERHLNAIRKLSREADDLKLQIEEAKISSSVALDDVTTWSSEVEAKLSSVNESVVVTGKWLNEIKKEANVVGEEEEDVSLQKKRQELLEFERAQLELKLENEKRTAEVINSQKEPSKADNVKLPNLTITKFNGKYEAWLPFWSKFVAEVDSTDLGAVSKFAYLKELIEPKVRISIDGQPFTTEGHDRSKNTLQTEYGKQSETVNTYILNIMTLPVITGTNPRQVDDFYKKLVHNAQSLETMGKLHDVTGNIQAVLDKLKGIKAGLVQGQLGWQDWDFPKLIEALRRWRKVNPDEETGTTHSKTPKDFPDTQESMRVCLLRERQQQI